MHPFREQKFFSGDAQLAVSGAECCICRGEIYDEQAIYFIDGDIVCTECLENYAEKCFAGNLSSLREIREMTHLQ